MIRTIHTVIIYIALSSLWFCKGNFAQGAKSGHFEIAIDLTRKLTGAEFKGELPDEKLFPASLWKKNPGRYSGLGSNEKWKNSQVTFKTSEEFLLNHSLDSIVFSPNSSYKFPGITGDFLFSGKLGVLSQNSFSPKGKFRIFSGEQLIGEIDLQISNKENWKEFSLPLKIEKNFRLEWISENSTLIAGAPSLSRVIPGKKHNIIFVVIDAVRKDAMGYAGFPFPVSPNLDEIAKESIIFENAFVNANWTKPSMISMLYSDYSSALGIGNIGFQVEGFRKKVFYALKKKNIAEVLRGCGYYTAAVMNNVFFLDYTGVGVDLGFHEIVQVGKEVKDTKKIIDESIDFSENNKNRNFFLHVNLNTPHTPYLPPKRIMDSLEKESANLKFSKLNEYTKKYLGEVRYADEELGRFFASLKKNGLYDNSFIIVTSDHGEVLSEYHDSANHPNGGIRFGHGESLFDEELSVPYLLKLPKEIQGSAKNKKIESQVSLLSFVPTVLSLAKIESPKENWKGGDYSDFILNGKNLPNEDVILSEGRLSEAIRTPKFKYVRRYPGFYSGEKVSTKTEQLYDLSKDPDERKNIASEYPKLLQEARLSMEKLFIKRNRYILNLPACKPDPCQYSGDLSLKGSVYRVLENPNIRLQELNRRRISFQAKPSEKGSELIIETVNPEFEFELNVKKDGQKIGYRIGRFGLSKGIDSMKHDHTRLFTSSRLPYGYENSRDVWIYNDSQFSGDNSSKDQIEMGEEVKSILKSWGYIHE